DQLLAHVEPTHEVGLDADRAEQGEDMLGDAVVEHALAGDRALLLRVERGRVVLEILDQRAGFGPLVEDLGLAFVDESTAGHGDRISGERTVAPRARVARLSRRRRKAAIVEQWERRNRSGRAGGGAPVSEARRAEGPAATHAPPPPRCDPGRARAASARGLPNAARHSWRCAGSSRRRAGSPGPTRSA